MFKLDDFFQAHEEYGIFLAHLILHVFFCFSSNPHFQNSFVPGNESKVVTVDDAKISKNILEPPEKKTGNVSRTIMP